MVWASARQGTRVIIGLVGLVCAGVSLLASTAVKEQQRRRIVIAPDADVMLEATDVGEQRTGRLEGRVHFL